MHLLFIFIFCFLAVRLVNNDINHRNNSDHYGAVEIYFNKKWWRLNDKQWSTTEANVVCRYLGYDRASEICHKTFPMITAPVLSVDFKCNGNERELAKCFRKEQKTDTSNNERGSGVRCVVDGEKVLRYPFLRNFPCVLLTPKL